jgi:hypothetical protein
MLRRKGGIAVPDKCPKCGARVSPSDDRCMDCGEDLLAAAAGPSPTSSGGSPSTVGTVHPRPGASRGSGGPQPRTLTLARVWLGLAAAGLPFAGWVLWEGSHSGDISGATGGFVLACMVVVLWVPPLAIAGVGLLRGGLYGWWMLLIYVGLGALVWAAWAAGSVLSGVGSVIYFWDRHRPAGQFLGGYNLRWVLTPLIPVAMLTLSIATIRQLLRDQPSSWDQGASHQPGRPQVTVRAGLEEGAHFVQAMRAQGSSDDEVRGSLRGSGWVEADVEALLAPPVAGPPRPTVSLKAVRKVVHAVVGLILISTVVALLGPIIGAFWSIEGSLTPSRKVKVVEIRVPRGTGGKTFSKGGVQARIRDWRPRRDSLEIEVVAVCPPLPHLGPQQWSESRSAKVELLTADGKRIMPNLMTCGGSGEEMDLWCSFRPAPVTGSGPQAVAVTFTRTDTRTSQP